MAVSLNYMHGHSLSHVDAPLMDVPCFDEESRGREFDLPLLHLPKQVLVQVSRHALIV